MNFSAMNERDNNMFEHFGREMLRPLPKNARLIVKGDLITNSARQGRCRIFPRIGVRGSRVLVPGLIQGLQVVQGLRGVPVFLYRYSMKISLKKARSPGTTEGGRSD
jgi:hypothetical protein